MAPHYRTMFVSICDTFEVQFWSRGTFSAFFKMSKNLDLNWGKNYDPLETQRRSSKSGIRARRKRQSLYLLLLLTSWFVCGKHLVNHFSVNPWNSSQGADQRWKCLFGVLLVTFPEAVATRDKETHGKVIAFEKQYALNPSVCCLVAQKWTEKRCAGKAYELGEIQVGLHPGSTAYKWYDFE